MKPIIKKQTYYSLLLMRDDSQVRTLRIKASTIRVLSVLLLLLLVCGALGLWGGVHYWGKYASLSERHNRQERELSESRLQLERYVNYETLLLASNATLPAAKNEEIGAGAPPLRVQNATQSGTAQTRLEPVAAPAARTVNATLPRHNASDATVSSSLENRPDATPKVPLLSSDASPLRITGFNGRVTGSQRFRIRYELSAVPSDDQKTIAGTAKYFAAFTNGTQVELPMQDIGDIRFAISRMKPMEANLRLPQGYHTRELQRINVTIELDEGKTYHEYFSVANERPSF